MDEELFSSPAVAAPISAIHSDRHTVSLETISRTGGYRLGRISSVLLNPHVCRRGCSPCLNIRLGNLGTPSNRHQEIQLVSRKSRTVRLLQQCQKSFYLRSKCEWRVGVNLQLPTRHVTQRRCKKGGNTHLWHLSKGKLKCI